MMTGAAGAALVRAAWAAQSFSGYRAEAVTRIVSAVASVPVPADTDESRAIAALPQPEFISPVPAGRTLKIPRPLGTVVVHLPPLMPRLALWRTVLLTLATRNALVVVPPPEHYQECLEVGSALTAAAVAAGAPDGAVQVLASLPASREPVAGLVIRPRPPSNVPVLVDDTAELAVAAKSIVDVKGFANSTVDLAPSVLIYSNPQVIDELGALGAFPLSRAECVRLASSAPPAGQPVDEIAERAGIAVPTGTRLLLAPIDHVVPEEPLAHVQPYPVLSTVRVAGAALGIRAARATVRLGGSRHALVYSASESTVLAFGTALPVSRVWVNGTGTLASWFDDGPGAEDLVTWTTMTDAPGYRELWESPSGPVPPYPHPSNRPPTGEGRA
jgi:hypothetical protein